MRIDFHSHVLPKMDDGSRSVEESLAMLRMLHAQGITHVVATPHFYPGKDDLERFLQRRDRTEALLREAMAKEPNLPTLLVGAEVGYFSGISESEALQRLTIDGGKYILIEMPAPPWTERMLEEVSRLREKQGIIPIVAHIDRYVHLFRNRRLPEQLSCYPVLVQANASFFLSALTAPMALRLLKQERIHLLGSDCHGAKERQPRLGDAFEVIRRRMGETILGRIDSRGKEILVHK